MRPLCNFKLNRCYHLISRIAPWSVVTRDVAPWSVVAGNPAHFIKKRELKEG